MGLENYLALISDAQSLKHGWNIREIDIGAIVGSSTTFGCSAVVNADDFQCGGIDDRSATAAWIGITRMMNHICVQTVT